VGRGAFTEWRYESAQLVKSTQTVCNCVLILPDPEMVARCLQPVCFSAEKRKPGSGSESGSEATSDEEEKEKKKRKKHKKEKRKKHKKEKK